jgi:hypothetical protein
MTRAWTVAFAAAALTVVECGSVNAAPANPIAGVWAEHGGCKTTFEFRNGAWRRLGNDSAGFIISNESVEGYESLCKIVQIDQPTRTSIILRLSCAAEGENYKDALSFEIRGPVKLIRRIGNNSQVLEKCEATQSSAASTNQSKPAKHLVIGYDTEAKINSSVSSCIEAVRNVTKWADDLVAKGADAVCESRKRHIDAYQSLQSAYQSLMTSVADDRRLSIDAAMAPFRTFIQGCIDHKRKLTNGGHNIQIEIMQNDIIASCLVIGSTMLVEENEQFKR